MAMVTNCMVAFIKKWLFAGILLLGSCAVASGQKVVSISIKGGINPASAEFIQQAVERSKLENASVLLIHLNTPGGLSSSTRDIVTSILQSPVPVVVFVAPSGAHAGSAGVFITMAAHIAAMAPGTNIGAAHPVNMQGKYDAVMMEKSMNDAVAFIRSVAEQRGRNAQWAEDAVRRSVAITATEALNNQVIDLIADNDADLLSKLDGRSVSANNKTYTLQTKHAAVEHLEMGFFQKMLDFISNPDVAYLLMMIGFFGVLFELFNPGAILPGIAGVVFLILAFYALSSMPVNYAGVALIVFGIILLLLEIKVVSHGMLAIGGAASVLLGSMFFFRTSSTQDVMSVSWSVIITTTITTTLFFLFVVGMGLKAQKAKTVSGAEALIGKTALTLTHLSPEGSVRCQGEIWKAVAVTASVPENEEVVVTGVQGLTLFVSTAGKS